MKGFFGSRGFHYFDGSRTFDGWALAALQRFWGDSFLGLPLLRYRKTNLLLIFCGLSKPFPSSAVIEKSQKILLKGFLKSIFYWRMKQTSKTSFWNNCKFAAHLAECFHSFWNRQENMNLSTILLLWMLLSVVKRQDCGYCSNRVKGQYGHIFNGDQSDSLIEKVLCEFWCF